MYGQGESDRKLIFWWHAPYIISKLTSATKFEYVHVS